MIGYSPRTAVPCISFASKDEKYRRQQRNLVRDEILKGYPGWRTIDWNQDPESRNMTARGIVDHDLANSAPIPILQIKSPTSGFGGSRILLSKDGTDETWQHIATGGGIISNEKGSCFLMTAAHAVPGYEGPSFPSSPTSDEFEFDMDDLGDEEDPDGLGVESTSLGSLTPQETRSSSSDIPSPQTSQSEDIMFSDLPSLEEIYEASEMPQPPLTRSTLSQASSTRDFHPPLFSKPPSLTSSESSRAGLDYALIELNPSKIGKEARSLDTGPPAVLHKLEPREVVVTTSSHGRTKGRLLETPLFIIRPGTTDSQELWTVLLENETMTGDSGSWVFDATSGELIGHIVAANTETGSTFIIPAHQVLEDLHHRFGGTWCPITSADGAFANASTTMLGRTPAEQSVRWPSNLSISNPTAPIGASLSRHRHSPMPHWYFDGQVNGHDASERHFDLDSGPVIALSGYGQVAIDQANISQHPLSMRGLGTWSIRQGQVNFNRENEDENSDSGREMGNTITRRPASNLHLHQEIRPLTDSDFELSPEFCPFYLYKPSEYSVKPWTSCTNRRAEISPMITHMISDHGLIRGNNSKRNNQRYLTRCGSHKEAKKGKSDCLTCSQVENWSSEQVKDQTHAGPSLCLRCYAKLETKEDLYRHLHETDICSYHEDFTMIQKSRTLYTTFCSATRPPRVRPPPDIDERPPRDGARIRSQNGEWHPGASATESSQNNQVPTQPTVRGSFKLPSLPLGEEEVMEDNEDYSGNILFTAQSIQAESSQTPRHPPNIRGQSREAFGPVARSRRRRMMESASGGASVEEGFVASRASPNHRSGRRRARESDPRRDYSEGRGHILHYNQSYMSNPRVQDYLVGVASFNPHPTFADPAPALQSVRQERTPEDLRTLEEELGNMVREMRERRRRDRQQMVNRRPQDRQQMVNRRPQDRQQMVNRLPQPRMRRTQAVSYQLEQSHDTILSDNRRPE
ncbi:hypothetical protein BGZ63DRAFT_69974 [Mariannaea sp. PMI_226]|nr:hypothetical protein BGZ63DRAFT_69974 [Mariannaea sp. PMI_226]